MRSAYSQAGGCSSFAADETMHLVLNLGMTPVALPKARRNRTPGFDSNVGEFSFAHPPRSRYGTLKGASSVTLRRQG
jgi:hypothetical protein